MSAPQYWELTVSVPADASEGLVNFVWELGALGVVEEEPGAGHGVPRLRAFFSGSVSADTLRARLHDYVAGLSALGFGVIDDARITAVTDPGWALAWRDHFRPLPVGRRLLVVPPWATAPRGRVVIVIEPGRAFGTGHHGSTIGCLELLELIVEREGPPRALDLGTGSGILAIAAAHLGVDAVLALDDDPDAVANARRNVALNSTGERVSCRLQEVSAVTADPAPLVLANLLAPAHRRLASTYRRLVTAGGSLVLGGILPAEAHQVGEALRRCGFQPKASRTREGWTALALARGD